MLAINGVDRISNSWRLLAFCFQEVAFAVASDFTCMTYLAPERAIGISAAVGAATS